MLVVDGGGLLIGFHLASANRHEVKLATSTLQSVRVPRGDRGRPKQLVADKAYDSKSFRGWLRRSRRIKPIIPSYQRRERKRPKRGRPIETGASYAQRWKVERTSAWLGNFRRFLVRQERYLPTFRAFFLVAFILVTLRQF